MIRFKENLPNLPYKGLPTPQRWGQTWDSLDLERKPQNIVPPVAGMIVIGFPMAAIGVGIGTVPALIGAPLGGMIVGAALGGLVLKVWKEGIEIQ